MNRQKAAERHEPQALLAFRAAVANGDEVADVVVLLLDTADVTGRRIVEVLQPDKLREADEALAQKKNHSAFITTVLTHANLLVVARAALTPDLAEYIAAAPAAPAGQFRILCFSDDGAEWFLGDVPFTGGAGDA